MTTLSPPALGDAVIRLAPLVQSDVPDLLSLTRVDDVMAFTLVRDDADEQYVSDWIGRYERGWEDGSCAGFSIRDAGDDSFLGFAAVVELQLPERQGELGYMLAPHARGRGAAGRAVALLTRWCFEELGLERLEMRISPANEGSRRVAERAGYRLEGLLRNLHFKQGLRSDVEIWSRLPGDRPAPGAASWLH
jgi:RimJ/RimL family protein N-acetyltransferase